MAHVPNWNYHSSWGVFLITSAQYIIWEAQVTYQLTRHGSQTFESLMGYVIPGLFQKACRQDLSSLKGLRTPAPWNSPYFTYSTEGIFHSTQRRANRLIASLIADLLINFILLGFYAWSWVIMKRNCQCSPLSTSKVDVLSSSFDTLGILTID